MANSTCGPIYVVDTVGTLQNCGQTYLVQSVSWDGQNGVTGVMQLEDGFGRVICYMKDSCSQFRSYWMPIPANGLVMRTLLAGTTAYIQVGS